MIAISHVCVVPAQQLSLKNMLLGYLSRSEKKAWKNIQKLLGVSVPWNPLPLLLRGCNLRYIFGLFTFCMSLDHSTYILVDGFTHKTRGYFASCVVLFRAPKGWGNIRVMSKISARILYVKAWTLQCTTVLYFFAFQSWPYLVKWHTSVIIILTYSLFCMSLDQLVRRLVKLPLYLRVLALNFGEPPQWK